MGRRKLKRTDDGAVAIEFALILPVLVMLVFGIIEFGMLFRADLSVSMAARSGARTAAALPRTAGYQTSAANAVAAQLRNTLSTDEITYLSIYKADKATGLPTDGGTYKSCSTCYRFTWDASAKSWTPEAGAAWAATAQKACGSEATTDYLGVYVEAKYKWVSAVFKPMFGDSMTVSERTIMRLEPIGTGSTCS